MVKGTGTGADLIELIAEVESHGAGKQKQAVLWDGPVALEAAGSISEVNPRINAEVPSSQLRLIEPRSAG